MKNSSAFRKHKEMRIVGGREGVCVYWLIWWGKRVYHGTDKKPKSLSSKGDKVGVFSYEAFILFIYYFITRVDMFSPDRKRAF